MKIPNQHFQGCAYKSSPSYVCLSCQTLFCRDCAKLVGIPSSCICKVCGSLCSDYKSFLQKQTLLADKAAPFGIEDFKSALRFPFRNFFANLGLGLIFGALLFSVPYLFSSGIGAIYAIAGVLPALIASGLMLGCNMRVINAVESGKPESKDVLDASEMLADLGETVALSCGILFVTLTPYLLSLRFTSELSLVQWLGFAWTVFYYPLALLVAASTNSFFATINPLNGLEIVKAHKSFYKFFFFYILISIIGGGLVLVTLIKLLQSVSGSPIIVLLPVFVVIMMILGSLAFYSNLVVSFLIGRIKFKESF